MRNNALMTISKKEYDRLDREMQEISSSISVPDDIDVIKPFDTLKGEKYVRAKDDKKG